MLRLCLITVIGPQAFLTGAQEAKPKRPAIVGISHVAVLASDLEASRKFYRDLLGLAHDAAITAGDERFFLSQRQWIELIPSSGAKPSGSSGRVAHVAFETADLGALRRYLLAYGVSVLRDAAVHPRTSRSFIVRDPLGNEIEFVQNPLASSTSEIPGRPVGRRLIHAGFVVNDRAAADRFYRDLLGFRLYWQGGMQNGQTDWVDMQVPEGTDWLEYMLNVAPDASRKVLGVMNHLAIGVSNIENAVDMLRSRGWTAKEKPQIGRDGKWQLNLYDPDLTRVEVMEFRPVQKPCCSDYTSAHPQ
jgi:catechol 2,3-dioxygenase-like lactoylglutathione lyase family enzyme